MLAELLYDGVDVPLDRKITFLVSLFQSIWHGQGVYGNDRNASSSQSVVSSFIMYIVNHIHNFLAYLFEKNYIVFYSCSRRY